MTNIEEVVKTKLQFHKSSQITKELLNSLYRMKLFLKVHDCNDLSSLQFIISCLNKLVFLIEKLSDGTIFKC